MPRKGGGLVEGVGLEVVGMGVVGRERRAAVVDWIARRAFQRWVRFGGGTVVVVVGWAFGGGQAVIAAGRGAVASRASWMASSAWWKWDGRGEPVFWVGGLLVDSKRIAGGVGRFKTYSGVAQLLGEAPLASPGVPPQRYGLVCGPGRVSVRRDL